MNKDNYEYSLIKSTKYSHKVASFNKSEKDYKVTNVVLINLNNWLCEFDKYITRYDKECSLEDVGNSTFILYDIENKLQIEGYKIINVYLPFFKDKCYNDDTKGRKYLEILICDSYEKMENIAKKNKVALMVVNKLKKLAEDDFFVNLYDQESEFKSCVESAKIEGEKSGIRKTAIEFLKNGASIELAFKSTGIPIDELKKMQKEVS